MSNRVWQNAGSFDAYHYIADALVFHESWRVLYMDSNVKVLQCDEGYFNILFQHHGLLYDAPDEYRHMLYITNSIRFVKSELDSLSPTIWPQVRKQYNLTS